MKLTNQEIYDLFSQLDKINEMTVYIPAKANFFIQKNVVLVRAAASEIEQTRMRIAQQYGELDEEKNAYYVSPENLDAANKEMAELFSIEQELDIKKISIEDLGNVELTPAQMQSLMFMID